MQKNDFDNLVQEGYLNAINNGPLTIYDYTFKTTIEKFWNPITRMARGLILDNNGDIIARPFPKFYNLGEMPETQIQALPAEIPELSNKYDGSMMIIFWNPYASKWQSTTRGCWDNPQIQYVNKWLEVNTRGFDKENTYLAELIGPWNRIVVFYPDTEVIMLGVVNNKTGEDWSYARTKEWANLNGYNSIEFEIKSPSSIDLATKVDNVEGFVGRYSNGLRVKLKYEQYMILHKILTGLSIKGIWESLQSDIVMDLSAVPDEFIQWYIKQRDKILNEYKDIENRAKLIFPSVPKPPNSRKESALFILKHDKDLHGILFAMLNGDDYSRYIWKLIKPECHETFQRSEERNIYG